MRKLVNAAAWSNWRSTWSMIFFVKVSWPTSVPTLIACIRLDYLNDPLAHRFLDQGQ